MVGNTQLDKALRAAPIKISRPIRHCRSGLFPGCDTPAAGLGGHRYASGSAEHTVERAKKTARSERTPSEAGWRQLQTYVRPAGLHPVLRSRVENTDQIYRIANTPARGGFFDQDADPSSIGTQPRATRAFDLVGSDFCMAPGGGLFELTDNRSVVNDGDDLGIRIDPGGEGRRRRNERGVACPYQSRWRRESGDARAEAVRRKADRRTASARDRHTRICDDAAGAALRTVRHRASDQGLSRRTVSQPVWRRRSACATVREVRMCRTASGRCPAGSRPPRQRWISAELGCVQSELAATVSYGRSAQILHLLLPVGSGHSASTVRDRTLRVGSRMEAELTMTAAPHEHQSTVTTVGLDGGYVRHCCPDPAKSFEIIAGRVLAEDGYAA
ncbi:hypothetical protein LMG28614_07092 [Paraburkholderia ultramafica]|uniref:Uncharacterized protein n=2 Tax=Paraburkholderia ultramafica TaxID=1544867 RepID=A0A6S7BRQ6_9BURK|nr:hypothetical protein LMG28614_07092 [Paraburkholderia ultramafica]